MRRTTLFKKLLYAGLSIVCIVSISIGVYTFTTNSKLFLQNRENYQANYLKMIDFQLKSTIEDIRTSISVIYTSEELSFLFQQTQDTPYKKYAQAATVEQVLKSSMFNNNEIKGYVVLAANQTYFVGGRQGNAFDYDYIVERHQQANNTAGVAEYNERYALFPVSAFVDQPKPADGEETGLEWINWSEFVLLTSYTYNNSEIYVLTFVEPQVLQDQYLTGGIYAYNDNGAFWTNHRQGMDKEWLLSPGPPVESGLVSTREQQMIYGSSMKGVQLAYTSDTHNAQVVLAEMKWYIYLAILVIVGAVIPLTIILTRQLTSRIARLEQVMKSFNGESKELTSKSFTWHQPHGKRSFSLNGLRYEIKLIIFYVMIILLSGVTTTILFQFGYGNIHEKQLIRSYEQSLKQAAANIDNLMDRYTRNARLLVTNPDVIQLLSNKHNGMLQEDRAAFINEEIASSLLFKSGLLNVIVRKFDGQPLLSYAPDVGNGFETIDENHQWVGGAQDSYGNHYYSLLWKVRSFGTSKETAAGQEGYVQLSFREEYLNQIYKWSSPVQNSTVTIVDQHNRVVSTSQRELINLTHVNAEAEEAKVIALEVPLQYANWRLVAHIPTQEIVKEQRALIWNAMLILSVMMLLSFLFTLQRTNSFTKPILILQSLMSRVNQGQLKARYVERTGDEIDSLGRSFNHMVERITELIEQNRLSQEHAHLLELNKKEAELNALQAQINPHFLYNTFESIIWMIEQKENEEAVLMITSLADLFRIGVNRGKNIVTLEEELTHAKAYTTIQQMRFGSKISVSWEVEISPSEVQMIKVIIQPILENAIFHGIELMTKPGHILVRIQEQQGALLIQIHDNGLGMSEEQLLSIRRRLAGELVEERDIGIGILNVNERIRLTYGMEYGVSIDSVLHHGTLVTLTIPLLSIHTT